MGTVERGARDRRYRAHRRGDHRQCLDGRPCRPAPEAKALVSGTRGQPAASASNVDRSTFDAPPMSPAARLDVELRRVAERLDSLHVALLDDPTSTPLLAECRGQQRSLVMLQAARGALGVVPVAATPNPLEELRARRAERMAGGA